MPFVETDKIRELNAPFEGHDKNTLYVFRCEVCGVELVGTLEDAYKQGFDTMGLYGNVLSPRTCGAKSCSIDKTVWWKVAMLKTPLSELNHHDLQVIKRILSEPDGIVYKGREKK